VTPRLSYTAAGTSWFLNKYFSAAIMGYRTTFTRFTQYYLLTECFGYVFSNGSDSNPSHAESFPL